MTALVDTIFPPLEAARVPYWRLVLRGVSQMCFQSNELTGLFFLAAVLAASPLSFAYLLVAAVMAPGGRMLMGERADELATGLPGLNPCLVALALPVFFEAGWSDLGMWGVLLISVAVTIVLVKLCLKILPFPILAFPFLLVLWSLFALAPHLDVLQPITALPAEPATFHPVQAVLTSLGQAVFSPAVLSGLLFAAGVLLSNWRHGVLAICGALIGTLVAYYYSDADAHSANLGLYGFNGVLAAVSVFVVCGGKLRLAILGALVATILTPVIAALGIQTLSAPFVFTTWLILGLGWLENRWFDAGGPQPSKAEVPPDTEASERHASS